MLLAKPAVIFDQISRIMLVISISYEIFMVGRPLLIHCNTILRLSMVVLLTRSYFTSVPSPLQIMSSPLADIGLHHFPVSAFSL